MLLTEMQKEEITYLQDFKQKNDYNVLLNLLEPAEQELFIKNVTLKDNPTKDISSDEFRYSLWALDYLLKGDNQNYIYWLANAFWHRNKDGTNFKLASILKQLVVKLSLENEFNLQVDFITLRETDYSDFCEKYAPEVMPEKTEEGKEVYPDNANTGRRCVREQKTGLGYLQNNVGGNSYYCPSCEFSEECHKRTSEEMTKENNKPKEQGQRALF